MGESVTCAKPRCIFLQSGLLWGFNKWRGAGSHARARLTRSLRRNRRKYSRLSGHTCLSQLPGSALVPQVMWKCREHLRAQKTLSADTKTRIAYAAAPRLARPVSVGSTTEGSTNSGSKMSGENVASVRPARCGAAYDGCVCPEHGQTSLSCHRSCTHGLTTICTALALHQALNLAKIPGRQENCAGA